MRIKVIVAALLALSLSAGVAEAHKVPFGFAKTEIRRFTAEVCSQTEGCRNWRVAPCKRRSLHRVDCVSTFFIRGGVDCSFVTIAIAPPQRYEVKIHRKRVIC